jgi:hypothetical protein
VAKVRNAKPLQRPWDLVSCTLTPMREAPREAREARRDCSEVAWPSPPMKTSTGEEGAGEAAANGGSGVGPAVLGC